MAARAHQGMKRLKYSLLRLLDYFLSCSTAGHLLAQALEPPQPGIAVMGCIDRDRMLAHGRKGVNGKLPSPSVNDTSFQLRLVLGLNSLAETEGYGLILTLN